MPDSPSPYKISINNGIYYFTTEHKREYSCIFFDIVSFLPPIIGIYDIEVFMFDFFFKDPEPHFRKIKDERVSATVKHLINDLFIKNENRVLIYVCDTSDGRGKQRYILFKKWYEKVADEYICDNIEIDLGESGPIYGAVLRSKEFPFNDVLKTEVIDRAEAIITDKFDQ